MKIELTKAENGYVTQIVKVGREEVRIHDTIEDAIKSIGRDALLLFEGKGCTFTGDRYGEVYVDVQRNHPLGRTDKAERVI